MKNAFILIMQAIRSTLMLVEDNKEIFNIGFGSIAVLILSCWQWEMTVKILQHFK